MKTQPTKDTTVKLSIFAIAILLTSALGQSATALETTATSRDVKEVNPEINITSQNAIITAAISKVNKDVLAILRCNNKNMFFKPQDSTADSDGCVGASISTTTKSETVNLANVNFDSYPGYKKSSKGYSGTSDRVIDLSGIAAKGAQGISVKATKTSFTGNCQKGDVTMNIANVNANVASTQFQCHYDNSPNRSTYFTWSYNGATKHLTVQARMSQTNSLMTSAKLTGVTAAYTITKTVLKVGDGK